MANIATKAGDVYQADVMRTVIDTVTFTIERDGDDPFAEGRDVARLHFESEPAGGETATESVVVANLRRIGNDGQGWLDLPLGTFA